MPTLKVVSIPNAKVLAFTNKVFITKRTFDSFPKSFVQNINQELVINLNVSARGSPDFVFMAAITDTGVNDDEIGLNAQHRKCANLTLQQPVEVTPFTPNEKTALLSVTVAVDLFVKKAGVKVEIDATELGEVFKSAFCNQVFRVNQALAIEFNNTKLDLTILSFEHADLGGKGGVSERALTHGQLLATTAANFRRADGSQSDIAVVGGELAKKNDALFRSDFNFEKLGIGGLDEQFSRMFRTAFASRIFPGVVRELGTNHVRGILLYGPPGCGKTLIARQIGKILNAREPKIVNGPEILDKYVGGSEEKVRDLFKDAEAEQKKMGDASMLHIIIFDEMDAIMKSRGSVRDSTGVADSVVNQLLSKIDGVDSLNNILIIGMTNRKDMIDEAILRPGRLEIHIEIPLPSEEGRLQILNIKTGEMRKNNRITKDCLEKLSLLAEQAKNFTGAELEGLVRNAASFALARAIDPNSLKTLDDAAIKVEFADFQRALVETTPAFGNKDDKEIKSYFKNGIHSYGEAFDNVYTTLQRLVNQVRSSSRTGLLSVLLEGAVASGKTAIAAKIASDSNYPFVRMIAADSMIGLDDNQRCNKILKVFADAYRSPLSVIFIDDIERIIEYTPVGHRFMNSVLQTILVLIRRIPPPPHSCKLLIIGTTAISHLLDDLQLIQAFNVTLHVSQLQTTNEYFAILKKYSEGVLSDAKLSAIAKVIVKPIGVKQLLLVMEMAYSEYHTDLDANRFAQCLQTVGY